MKATLQECRRSPKMDSTRRCNNIKLTSSSSIFLRSVMRKCNYRASQIAPSWPSALPIWPKVAPRCPNCPKDDAKKPFWKGVLSKLACSVPPKLAKMAPSTAKMAPIWLKMIPRLANMAPRSQKMAPRWAQDVQADPKMKPRDHFCRMSRAKSPF